MSNPTSSPILLPVWQRPLVRPMQLVVARTDRLRIAMLFASLFAFLGVTGKLFIPFGYSLRSYYLILPLGLLTLTLLGTKATWKVLLICVPIIAYIIYSGATANLVANQSHTGTGGMAYSTRAASALLAALMLVNQILFVVVTATHIRHGSTQDKVRIIEYYLLGFLLTLCVGYVFLIGGSAGVLSYPNFINKFSYTLHPTTERRFMPGSDANEYAIMASFALTTMVLYQITGMGRRQAASKLMQFLAHWWVMSILIPMAFVALLFTGTRSAIIAFACGVVWIFCRKLAPQFRRLRMSRNTVLYFASCGIAGATVAIPFVMFQSRYLTFLLKKFSDASQGTGTAEDRLVLWSEGLSNFLTSPLLGHGYHTHEYIHNTWLQVICDLGVLGCALLIATGAAIFAQFRSKSAYADPIASISAEDEFLTLVKEIAVGTVLWFAMTNHNFDQFLTWFTVLIVLGLSCQTKPRSRFRQREVFHPVCAA